MDNCCVICGAVIPEGRQVCPGCDQGSRKGSLSFAEKGGLEEHGQNSEG